MLDWNSSFKDSLLKRPLTNDQIIQLLKTAWENDMTMFMVTQEILIYLAMLISTEQALFQGMIRLRTGLIIQVMIGELQRTLSCSGKYLWTFILALE